MKKIILIILFMLNISIFSNDFGLSLKGGMNLSGFNYDSDQKYDLIEHDNSYIFNPFIIASLALDYRIFNNLSIGIELVSNNISLGNVILAQIEIPIYFLYKYKMFNFYLGGFYSHVHTSNAPVQYYNNCKEDYGFVLGVQFERNNLLVDLRYEQGFNIVYDHRRGDEQYDYYYNISQFSIMIGYRFF
jgi:hypothetical protein